MFGVPFKARDAAKSFLSHRGMTEAEEHDRFLFVHNLQSFAAPLTCMISRFASQTVFNVPIRLFLSLTCTRCYLLLKGNVFAINFGGNVCCVR